MDWKEKFPIGCRVRSKKGDRFRKDSPLIGTVRGYGQRDDSTLLKISVVESDPFGRQWVRNTTMRAENAVLNVAAANRKEDR